MKMLSRQFNQPTLTTIYSKRIISEGKSTIEPVALDWDRRILHSDARLGEALAVSRLDVENRPRVRQIYLW